MLRLSSRRWDEVISRGGHCTGLQAGETEELHVPGKIHAAYVKFLPHVLTIISALNRRISFQHESSWTREGCHCPNVCLTCVCSQCVTCANFWTRKCCYNNCKTSMLTMRSGAVKSSRILQFCIDYAQPVVCVPLGGVDHPT